MVPVVCLPDFLSFSTVHDNICSLKMAGVQSFNTELSPRMGEPFQISATIPLEKPEPGKRNRVPITLHLSKRGVDVPLGCYVYTIPSNKLDTVAPFHQTLLNNSREGLLDITKRLGGLITKKYQVPSYVSVSGDNDWEMDDLVPTIQEIIQFIESKW